MANKTNSLSITTWMCKYHIVFIPKYRRKSIYGTACSAYADGLTTIRVTMSRTDASELPEKVLTSHSCRRS